MFPSLRIAILLASLLVSGLSVQGQFKKLLRADSATFSSVGTFIANQVIETGLPGREVAIAGGISGVDTSGMSVQPAYLLQTDGLGVPQVFSYYTDMSPFLISGSRAYGLCYDGAGHFYLATGSNDNPIVIRTDMDGVMQWAIDGNHHDYYGIMCEGERVYMLGQDESFLGAHDFSIHSLDSAGAPTVGTAYGTTNFDQPKGFARIPDGFIMAGFTFANGNFQGMVVKATTANDLAWGNLYGTPNRSVYLEDVVSLPGGQGALMAGRLRGIAGGPDSVLVTRFDTSGGVQWVHLFGTDVPSTLDATAIDYDPVSGNILVGGNYKTDGYFKPFAMLLDGNGDYLWSRSYADNDSTVEELLQDVVIANGGSDFYAVGNRVRVSNTLVRSIFLVKAGMSDGLLPCDSTFVMGQGTGELAASDVVFTESLTSDRPYPYQGGGGSLVQEVQCSVMVGLNEPIPVLPVLSVVNPVGHEMVVETEALFHEARLEVLDLHGKTLLRRKVSGERQRQSLDVSGLAAGIYFVRLSSPGAPPVTRKVVKY